MKCPNCGEELSIISVDSEEYDCKYFVYYEGKCPECEMTFEWYDLYEYTETSYPRQINDHR